MIVHRVVWPVMAWAYQAPQTPHWFRQSVRERFLQDSPHSPLPFKKGIALFAWPVLIMTAHVVWPSMFSHAVVLLAGFSAALMVVTTMFFQVEACARTIREGRRAYDQAVESTLVHMSAHERMEYRNSVQVAGATTHSG